MYVIAQHKVIDPETAFPRGQALIDGTGAPDGTRVLQFYPHTGGTAVTCLWETRSVPDVQDYVDTVLGDSAVTTCYEVDGQRAFADRPLGLNPAPAPVAG
ncbi:hypothetical protein LG634_04835 [Streptomyces bambusae]|uniref:hypothetical protein n=1 Tax=Streptomyces bambusae TaxID=1550616 RepID=UPI001CFF2D03|nr:hypothetical protein [Streptomyces bambusae]MCB5164161.1 hypothetical protein [Streptomyces bambusae]